MVCLSSAGLADGQARQSRIDRLGIVKTAADATIVRRR